MLDGVCFKLCQRGCNPQATVDCHPVQRNIDVCLSLATPHVEKTTLGVQHFQHGNSARLVLLSGQIDRAGSGGSGLVELALSIDALAISLNRRMCFAQCLQKALLVSLSGLFTTGIASLNA